MYTSKILVFNSFKGYSSVVSWNQFCAFGEMLGKILELQSSVIPEKDSFSSPENLPASVKEN